MKKLEQNFLKLSTSHSVSFNAVYFQALSALKLHRRFLCNEYFSYKFFTNVKSIHEWTHELINSIVSSWYHSHYYKIAQKQIYQFQIFV